MKIHTFCRYDCSGHVMNGTGDLSSQSQDVQFDLVVAFTQFSYDSELHSFKGHVLLNFRSVYNWHNDKILLSVFKNTSISCCHLFSGFLKLKYSSFRFFNLELQMPVFIFVAKKFMLTSKKRSVPKISLTSSSNSLFIPSPWYLLKLHKLKDTQHL